jgi:hypothetical protein
MERTDIAQRDVVDASFTTRANIFLASGLSLFARPRHRIGGASSTGRQLSRENGTGTALMWYTLSHVWMPSDDNNLPWLVAIGGTSTIISIVMSGVYLGGRAPMHQLVQFGLSLVIPMGQHILRCVSNSEIAHERAQKVGYFFPLQPRIY